MAPAAMDVPVSFDNVRDKNMMLLKKLNAAIFPVKYQDSYYSDAMAAGDFTKLAYYGDVCVGNVACRVEKTEKETQIYIMTLGVLAPYRNLGIGTKLLNSVLDLCHQEPKVSKIYLHVQVNNEEAINFYRKFGFDITDTIQDYYIRINPPHCHVLTKSFSRSS